MPKKSVKRPNLKQQMTSAEVEARHEEQTLRRLKSMHRRIVALSRDVKRAVRAADAARLDAARELCADTGFAVFLIDEVAATQRTVYERDDTIDALRKRIAELEPEPAAAVL
jgi:ATP:corrinoid adenosyltransferase